MKWEIKAKHEGKLIREYLQEVASFSKRLLIKAKSSDGKIQVNGIHQTVRYRLQEGDLLTVKLPPETIAPRMEKENVPLEIVYEDDYLLVVYKPAGVVTIPSSNHPTGSIANRLLYYYEIKNIPSTVHIVTRLDKDTSGLVLIAKSQYSHSRLSALQKQQDIKREYRAFVEGNLKCTSGTINQPIDRMEGSIIQRKVASSGKEAVTHYRVVKQFSDYACMDLELETGRTHQIRVHMAYMGYPLLGDDLYGGSLTRIKRQALHCKAISFTHPFTHQEQHFAVDVPVDMQKLWI